MPPQAASPKSRSAPVSNTVDHPLTPQEQARPAIYNLITNLLQHDGLSRILIIIQQQRLVYSLHEGLSQAFDKLKIGRMTTLENEPSARIVIGTPQTLRGQRLNAVLDYGAINYLISEKVYDEQLILSYDPIIEELSAINPNLAIASFHIGAFFQPIQADLGQTSQERKAPTYVVTQYANAFIDYGTEAPSPTRPEASEKILKSSPIDPLELYETLDLEPLWGAWYWDQKTEVLTAALEADVGTFLLTPTPPKLRQILREDISLAAYTLLLTRNPDEMILFWTDDNLYSLLQDADQYAFNSPRGQNSKIAIATWRELSPHLAQIHQLELLGYRRKTILNMTAGLADQLIYNAKAQNNLAHILKAGIKPDIWHQPPPSKIEYPFIDNRSKYINL